jgi:putative phosphoesterase
VIRALLLADTHVAPGGKRRLPDTVYELLADVDVVLHAGDVTEQDLLSELGGFAPVHAVLGNNDHALLGELPERDVVDLDGVRVAMVHDSGAAAGRAVRLHRWFPDAEVVVYGHSHLPEVLDGVDGQRLCNPGSPTWKRMAPAPTCAVLEVDDGAVARLELVVVGAS